MTKKKKPLLDKQRQRTRNVKSNKAFFLKKYFSDEVEVAVLAEAMLLFVRENDFTTPGVYGGSASLTQEEIVAGLRAKEEFLDKAIKIFMRDRNEVRTRISLLVEPAIPTI